jgi:hypothetical protein
MTDLDRISCPTEWNLFDLKDNEHDMTSSNVVILNLHLMFGSFFVYTLKIENPGRPYLTLPIKPNL